jgi:hypothetical protein
VSDELTDDERAQMNQRKKAMDAVIRRERARPIEDALRAELADLRAKWDAIPWDALAVLTHQDYGATSWSKAEAAVVAWYSANAPEASQDAIAHDWNIKSGVK